MKKSRIRRYFFHCFKQVICGDLRLQPTFATILERIVVSIRFTDS